MSQNPRYFVYQIFYDEKSRASLDPGFIPLDNTANERPDWYELWVIRNFLKSNELKEDVFYGFLSPRFREKSGFHSATVHQLLASCHTQCDVALLSTDWDQLAYFLNPFEQGDLWHPGLMKVSQDFCDALGLNIRLDTLVTYSKTSAFCNYVIGKRSFWHRWLSIADALFNFAEQNPADGLGRMTAYGSSLNLAPMKTFVQERLATLVLTQGTFRAMSFGFGHNAPIFERVFRNNARTRLLLETCNLMKEKFCVTRDEAYLKTFYRVRRDIEFHRPVF
jgi:hypothetical protein